MGRWFGIMNHVATIIGGVEVDLKTTEQSGAVYRVVPKARRQAALAFLSRQVFTTPAWLQPTSIVSRIGPRQVVATRQAALVTSLLSATRLGRMAESEKYDATAAYLPAEYLADLTSALFTGAAPDAHRRQLQRVMVQRLEALIAPPATPAAGGPGGGGGGQAARYTPFVTAPNVPLSDLPALARQQLQSVRRTARDGAVRASESATVRAHWQDLADRITAILEPAR